MGFDFSLVDVFTDRPFGGNRLAVFPYVTGTADATMQQLARVRDAPDSFARVSVSAPAQPVTVQPFKE